MKKGKRETITNDLERQEEKEGRKKGKIERQEERKDRKKGSICFTSNIV
jgi:hypothetical protein